MPILSHSVEFPGWRFLSLLWHYSVTWSYIQSSYTSVRRHSELAAWISVCYCRHGSPSCLSYTNLLVLFVDNECVMVERNAGQGPRLMPLLDLKTIQSQIKWDTSPASEDDWADHEGNPWENQSVVNARDARDLSTSLPFVWENRSEAF